MDDDGLRRRLTELTAGQPAVDWRGSVHRQVVRRRRRRYFAVAAVSVVVAASGVTAALARPGGGTERLTVADSPEPSPTATTESSPSPSGAPTATGSPAVSRSVPPPVSDSPSPRATASSSPVVNHVTVTVSVSPKNPYAGEAATINVQAHGSAGNPFIDRVDFGDGQGVSSIPGCTGESSPPTPRDVTMSFQHAWKANGRYTVSAHASSICSAYKGDGTGSLDVVVIVHTVGGSVGSGAPSGSPSPPSPSPTTSTTPAG